MSKATQDDTAEEQVMQDPDESWAQRMTQRCERMVRPQVPRELTIYQVPASIREADKGAFEPKMFSIGPYHHRANARLEAMEERKWLNLKLILSGHPEIQLVDLLKEIKTVEIQIRNCYSENIKFSSQELVEMMVLDGCFIISFLLSLEDQRAWDWDWSHPICKTRWLRPILRYDVLLLENQVPFFVLKRLFHRIYESNYGGTADRLLHLAVKFCNGFLPRTEEKNICQLQSVHHLLHLFHWLHRPSEGFETVLIDPELKPLKAIRSAKEIMRSGVKLKSKPGSPLNVEFRSKDGVLEIPTLQFNYQSYSVFRNLVAFEQSSDGYGTDFTSYAFFMDCLVDNVGDLGVLKRSSIIEHNLGTDKQVRDLINRLCSRISFDARQGYMSSVIEQQEFCTGSPQSRRGRRLQSVGGWVGLLKLEIAFFTLYLSVLQTFAAIAALRPGSKSS